MYVSIKIYAYDNYIPNTTDYITLIDTINK